MNTTEPKRAIRSVAVIGAGNLGSATAAFLGIKGLEVRIFDKEEKLLNGIRERHGIEAHGIVEGLAPVIPVDTIGQAIEGVDLIISAVPAFSHAEIAGAMGPYLSPGQIILIQPGQTFSAFTFHRELTNHGNFVPIMLVETTNTLFTTRLVAPGKVEVYAMKRWVPTACFPAIHNPEVVPQLHEIFPSICEAESVLEIGLNNLNAVLHPPITLFSLSLIERAQPFLYYIDGATPAVMKVAGQIDAERVRLGEALGVNTIPADKWFYKAYETDGANLYQMIQNNIPYKTIAGPDRIGTRLLLEDIPTGLVPMASVGRALGIPCPVIEALIETGKAIFDIPFQETGRKLSDYGLDHATPAQMRNFAQTGKLS